MSQATVKTIIDRAITDEKFHEQLYSNVEAVFAEYTDLTDEEKTSLRNLKPETVDQFSGEVDDRTSKGSVSAWGG